MATFRIISGGPARLKVRISKPGETSVYEFTPSADTTVEEADAAILRADTRLQEVVG